MWRVPSVGRVSRDLVAVGSRIYVQPSGLSDLFIRRAPTAGYSHSA